jgi:hypothetical protein
MPQAYGAAAHAVIGIVAAFGKVEQVIHYYREKAAVFFKLVYYFDEHERKFVNGIEIFVAADFLYVLFKTQEELLDTEVKNILFVFKIDVEGCPGDAAAVGYFLKGNVLEAFVHKNIESFFEYFPSALIVFNNNRHTDP